MENLDRMFETGLYINDLGLHDSSRDLVLAGTQQSAELKLALDQVKSDVISTAAHAYSSSNTRTSKPQPCTSFNYGFIHLYVKSIFS